VHNIEKMVHNIERHGDDDQHSNDKLAKYKKMIEDSKKPFYHGCVAQYSRLFAMVKLFEDLLMLLKDMLPQDNAVAETVCEAKQIICPLDLEVEKIHIYKSDCILYHGPEYEDLEKCPICGLN
jgi:hypothetical protein